MVTRKQMFISKLLHCTLKFLSCTQLIVFNINQELQLSAVLVSLWNCIKLTLLNIFQNCSHLKILHFSAAYTIGELHFVILLARLLEQYQSINWRCLSICLYVIILVKVFGLSEISAMESGTNLNLSLKITSIKFYWFLL